MIYRNYITVRSKNYAWFNFKVTVLKWLGWKYQGERIYAGAGWQQGVWK